MARTAPFDAHPQRYDDWFEIHRDAYVSELLALRAFVPLAGRGLEIGVGTGRFAVPLGARVGVDPSDEMLARAKARGIEVFEGVAEALPFDGASFDFALVITTICFVDSAEKMIDETRRVLRPGGKVVLGFIDRETGLGRDYLASQADNVFYRDATFYSCAEVEEVLRGGGFRDLAWAQTLCRPVAEVREIEPARSGTGTGAFVAVEATRGETLVPSAVEHI
jgi:SAM-dependent methyltransferase